MRGDATRFGSVAVCPRCNARFGAHTSPEALRLLDAHQAAAGCHPTTPGCGR